MFSDNVNLYNCVVIVVIALGQLTVGYTGTCTAVMTGHVISGHTFVTVGPLLIFSTFARFDHMPK